MRKEEDPAEDEDRRELVGLVPGSDDRKELSGGGARPPEWRKRTSSPGPWASTRDSRGELFLPSRTWSGCSPLPGGACSPFLDSLRRSALFVRQLPSSL